jgi:hypothetical protein
MNTSGVPPSCPRCRTPYPADAHFCPECGGRLDSGETLELPLPRHGVASAQSLYAVHRRPFGAHPVPFLAALAAGFLLVAVLLFALAGWVGGIIVLCFGLATAVLFLAAARSAPEAPLARRTLSAEARICAVTRLLAVGLRVWTRAGIQLLQFRARRRRLRRELEQRLAPLGEAVHRGDDTRAERIRAQAGEIERALQANHRASSAVITGARGEFERERDAAGSTRVIPTTARREPAQPAERPRT